MTRTEAKLTLKKEVTLGQALGFFATLVTIIFTSWMDMKVTQTEHDIKIKELDAKYISLIRAQEDRDKTQDVFYEKILTKLQDIQLQLKDKEDRK